MFYTFESISYPSASCGFRILSSPSANPTDTLSEMIMIAVKRLHEFMKLVWWKGYEVLSRTSTSSLPSVTKIHCPVTLEHHMCSCADKTERSNNKCIGALGGKVKYYWTINESKKGLAKEADVRLKRNHHMQRHYITENHLQKKKKKSINDRQLLYLLLDYIDSVWVSRTVFIFAAISTIDIY